MRDNSERIIYVTDAKRIEWDALAQRWTQEALAETARISAERNDAAFQRFMAKVLNG